MAKTANSYILPQGNRTPCCILTAAKASRANLTDAVKICDAGANDSLVKGVWATPRDAMAAANQIALYLYDGATVYLVDIALMAAYTPWAAMTAPTPTVFAKPTSDQPIYLPTGWSLYAGMATALAAGVAVTALIEDY